MWPVIFNRTMSSTFARLSKHRGAVIVAVVANTASLLFGFDTGVAGSVVALKRLVQNKVFMKYNYSHWII
jgi:hypothetical protein